MSKGSFNKSENIDNNEYELAFQRLCEFEKNYCEVIFRNSNNDIVYKIDPVALAELENVTEEDLKNLDLKEINFNTVEFPSYESLFVSKYKQKFLKNMTAISRRELEKKLGKETLVLVAEKDVQIWKNYITDLKERDIDNDGVSNRIDIDDTRNSVQTVSDLNIVKNTTSKETSRDHEKNYEREMNDIGI